MIRIATPADFEPIHRIRLAVRENVLSNPASIGRADYEEMLGRHGRGWVFEEQGRILGFAIGDGTRRNVWALFVQPGHERRGIGRALLEAMMDWMFERSHEPVWLTTGPSTRAAEIYRKAGWRETGTEPNGDLRMELSWEDHRTKNRR